MNTLSQKKVTTQVIHFIALAIFLSQMVPAAWKKITEFEPMMKGMASYGYDHGVTIFIGWTEIIGCLILILGIFRPILKNFMMLFFLLLVVGAMATHLAVRDYVYIRASIICIITATIVLSTSESFRLFLNYKQNNSPT